MQQLIPPNSSPTSVSSICSSDPKADESIHLEPVSQDLPPQPQASQRPAASTLLGIFSTTFITVFLAELGDKTQLTTLLMSAESQTPWVVFMGAAAALVLTSILGVLVGQWCARYLSPKFLQRAAGISLLLIAGWLFWDVINV